MEENQPITYKSLSDIRIRKEMLRNDILKDDQKIKTMWRSLFKKPDALKKNATPGSRISSLVGNGAGILDGLILGWKLYRKFKK